MDDYLLDMAEYDDAYKHWANVARHHFTRAQIVETAKDNRDMCSPIWQAMQDELTHRDKLALAKEHRNIAKSLKRFDRRSYWRRKQKDKLAKV